MRHVSKKAEIEKVPPNTQAQCAHGQALRILVRRLRTSLRETEQSARAHAPRARRARRSAGADTEGAALGGVV